MKLVSPFASGFSFLKGQLGQVRYYFSFQSTLMKENETLKAEVSQLQLAAQSLHQDVEDAKRFRELFAFQKLFPEQLLPARVISYPPLSAYRMIMIDKGASDGVKRRAAVLTPQGLVGQIAKVGEHQAEVLLMIDPTSAVDARIERTGARGLIVGKSISVGLKRDLFLGAFEYLNRTVEVAAGDLVRTSGLDGVYPAGISIGRVREVKQNEYGIFQEADLIPTVDFDKITEVLVGQIALVIQK